MMVPTIDEDDSETSESVQMAQEKKNKRKSIRRVGTVERDKRQEQINEKLLKGVDSDEEVLEELVKNAKELKKMQ